MAEEDHYTSAKDQTTDRQSFIVLSFVLPPPPPPTENGCLLILFARLFRESVIS